MSIIYGVLLPAGRVVQKSRLIQLGGATAHQAPDGISFQIHERIGMSFQAYHTHARSKFGVQPETDPRGNMLTLDGRIDNYRELSQALGIRCEDLPDSQLVLAAFDLWGENCFARLHGDWALALWSHVDRTLYLARDHAGTRTLYFGRDQETVLWSTYLDTFLSGGHSYSLSREFARTYISGRRTSDLTPYEGVQAVPAAQFIRFREGEPSYFPHWSSLAEDEIRYRRDQEYEDRFRALFAQAVRRRVVDRVHPVIAELSGGMDSSSIVCMADQITSVENPDSGLIETLSYYDDSEPNWNERPYISAVETQRNHTGRHVELSFASRGFERVAAGEGAYRWPGATRSVAEHHRRVATILNQGGYRSIVSGIGGDELLGGVPFALPELADQLASGRLSAWVSQAIRWCLADRSPLIWMLRDSFAFAISAYRGKDHRKRSLPPWMMPEQEDANGGEIHSAVSIRERMRSRPSAIANCFTWRSILETLPSKTPPPSAKFEYLYPYLDKDLVDFLLRVPPEQLVKPGRRRAMMRRALAGIVPPEILERRRKAFAIRGPLRSLQQAGNTLERLFQKSRLAEMGLIDPHALSRHLGAVLAGTTTQWWPSLMTTALYESWVLATEANHSETLLNDPCPEGHSSSLAPVR